MPLSENIRVFRANKDWTQADLAKFSGVSIETIKRYENGKTNPTTDNLSKIAEALGVKVKIYMTTCPLVSLSRPLVQKNLKN